MGCAAHFTSCFWPCSCSMASISKNSQLVVDLSSFDFSHDRWWSSSFCFFTIFFCHWWCSHSLWKSSTSTWDFVTVTARSSCWVFQWFCSWTKNRTDTVQTSVINIVITIIIFSSFFFFFFFFCCCCFTCSFHSSHEGHIVETWWTSFSSTINGIATNPKCASATE